LAGQSVLVPRDVIEVLAQPARIGQVSRDTQRLDSIRASLLSEGLRAPLEVAIEGRVVLRDGHHRFTCTGGMEGWDIWPVVFTGSDGIRVRAVPIADVILPLLTRAESPWSKPTSRTWKSP
jgi:hypothetical protein